MSNQSWSIDTSSGLPVIRAADGSPIADLWIREDTNELAALISAAPDLFKALKTLTDICGRNVSLDAAPTSPLGIAHAAIAKASPT